ncbi:hypothetical protein GF1_18890 [Desulfolithobacter dissulfuricans]|uniref:Uncharacterized protein n=1 Tax=Desulfolithobacter dissulfuricans TaxID=2795293 RepID=A0A915U121_9BACT|nr:hypothetical protein GF1_18890 [Desulfolithobacter dissulfuricans]
MGVDQAGKEKGIGMGLDRCPGKTGLHNLKGSEVEDDTFLHHQSAIPDDRTADRYQPGGTVKNRRRHQSTRKWLNHTRDRRKTKNKKQPDPWIRNAEALPFQTGV